MLSSTVSSCLFLCLGRSLRVAQWQFVTTHCCVLRMLVQQNPMSLLHLSRLAHDASDPLCSVHPILLLVLVALWFSPGGYLFARRRSSPRTSRTAHASAMRLAILSPSGSSG